MSFLKLIKLDLEVRLSDQLQFPIYIVLFIVDGLFMEPPAIIIIVRVLIDIACNWRASSVGFTFAFVGLGHTGDECIRRSKTRTRLAGDKLGDSF